MKEYLNDELSVLRSMEEYFFWFDSTEDDYLLEFERNDENEIIRFKGSYNLSDTGTNFIPVRFSFPCANQVLHSVNDEPGVIIFDNKGDNYEEHWLHNGQMQREGKPCYRVIKEGQLSLICFNDPKRSSKFPREFHFVNDGVLVSAEWCDIDESEDHVLVDARYYHNACIESRTFGFKNDKALAGVRLDHSYYGERLIMMTRFRSEADSDEFEYHTNTVLSWVRLGLNRLEEPSSITQPAVTEYDNTGNIIREEYWIEGTEFNSYQDWLNDERVSEHKRELYNENSIVTNVSL